MTRRFTSLFVYLITVPGLLIAGLQTVSAQMETGTYWRDAVITELDVGFGDTGFHARWRYHRCLCGDVWVKVEEIDPDSVVSGELMLVGGKVLLSRGMEEQGGGIEPLIQAPTLMLQLAHVLLNRSQPKGPHVVKEKQTWEVTEKTGDLKINTGMTTGTFTAPWTITGSGWESSPGRRSFELLFQFTVLLPGQEEVRDSMTLSGELDFRKQEFLYPESTNLEGWRVQWFSKGESESKPTAKGLTLKELRQQTKT